MSIDINPRLWGREGWVFLHNIAKGYPSNPTPIDKNNYKITFESLKDTLPCKTCRNNYKQHLREFPIKNYLHNRKSLLNWVRLVKNKTNIRIVTVERQKNLVQTERMQRIQNRRINRGKAPCCGR